MQLPSSLRRAVEAHLARFEGARLRTSAARLSECYREGGAAVAMSSDELRAAYLAVRLPATYAAVHAALGWSAEGTSTEFVSVLDLGCGPGTALWAAAECFPSLRRATGFERDGKLLALARQLAAEADSPLLREASWLAGDLTSRLPEERYDLVLCSYAMNELTPVTRARLAREAWARTAKMLVLIEPGTKAGFANILSARDLLLREGGVLAAPCPHSAPCPMAQGDWCHFAARIERTADHRRLKQAELGHEDEKFSYIALLREEAVPAAARIVRHPRTFSGYVQLQLCREGRVEGVTVTRSQKEDWRRLKRLGWGDRW